MNIETIKINTVRPYWRNPRKNDKTVEALVKSIKTYGYNVPIVVDKEGIILAGHARYRALTQLGYEEIMVVRVDLPEAKARQYRLADNKAGEFSEWDFDTLKSELESMGVGGVENLTEFFGDESFKPLFSSAMLNGGADMGSESEQGESEGFSGGGGPAYPQEAQGGVVIELLCPHCLEENNFTEEEFKALVAKARAVAAP